MSSRKIDYTGYLSIILSVFIYLVLITLPIQAQPNQQEDTKNTVQTNSKISDSIDSQKKRNKATEPLLITLYPQHDRVELVTSGQLIDSWPLFFGSVRSHLNNTLTDKALKSFLYWKRTQESFTQLTELEELQLILSNHLLTLDHGQTLKSEEVNHKDKLNTLLKRLNLENELLNKEESWREQEKMLKTRLTPLNELWLADQDLKDILEDLSLRLESDLSQLKDELENISEIYDDDLVELEHDAPVDEATLEALLERELLSHFNLELKETVLDLESAYSALQLFHKSISEREERLKKCIESLERLLFDSAQLLRELPQLKESNQRQIKKVNLWLRYWNIRTQFERKHTDTSVETLLSQVTSKENVIKTKWKGLNDIETELRNRVHLFHSNYKTPLQNKSPPIIKKVDSKNSYLQVKSAHDTALQFLTFHSERKLQIESALDQAQKLLEDSKQFLKNLRLNLDLFIEADVILVSLLRAQEFNLDLLSVSSLIDHAKDRPSEVLIKKILKRQEEWNLQSSDLTEFIQLWTTHLEEDEEAISRLDSELHGDGGLIHRLELERTWLEFIQEIEGLDGPSLLAKHNEALSIYTEQKNKVSQLKKSYQHQVLLFTKTWRELENLSDPLLRQHKSDHAAFEIYAQEIITLINKVDKLEEESSSFESPQEESNEKGKSVNIPLNPVAIQLHERGERHQAKVKKVQLLARTFRDRLPPRITYYRQKIYKLNELKVLMTQRLKLIDSLQGELAKRVEFARQVRRTASVIRQRVLEQELPTEAMNEEIETHGQREWVEQLRAEGLEDQRKQAAYDEYRLGLEPKYKELLKPLESWRDLLNDILDLTMRQVELINEAQRDQNYSRGAISSPDTLTKEPIEEVTRTLSERQFEHKLRMRIHADYPWYDFFWNSFTSDQVLDIEELIKDHYVELLRTEMEQAHLESRIHLTKTLAEHITSQRPLLEVYQKQLLQVSKALQLKLDSQKVGILIRFDQQKSMTQLTQKNSTSLDYLALKQFENREDRLEAIAQLEQLWAVKNAYHAALDDLAVRLSPQGNLEMLSGEMNDAISQLETERDELTRPLLRLLGERARGADLNNESPRVGEIDRLHQERAHEKLSVLIRSLLSFLLIPLVTLLSFKTIAGIEKRIKSISEKELERLIEEGEILTRQKRAEREDRLMTLLQVMRTTSKVVIYTVATGALLKALQVDVTPIIASAGIIGLAFAFGAQELVKDFFAGVFILFENQYNRGDFVTINGIFGWIDKITLRLTVIRDSHGVIHFIPNGQVQLVSNHNKEWSQAHLEIGASYNNPPKQVIDCLRKICEEVSIDPVIGEDVMGWEVLGLERFDDSAVVYRVHLRTAPKEKWRVARHYRRRVMEAFALEGIEIPFPQMVVTLPSSSTLENEQL